MEKESKIRIALCGIQEEVNTFATESMGFATVTGDPDLLPAYIRQVAKDLAGK